jgi:hypothetical protein
MKRRDKKKCQNSECASSIFMWLQVSLCSLSDGSHIATAVMVDLGPTYMELTLFYYLHYTLFRLLVIYSMLYFVFTS